MRFLLDHDVPDDMTYTLEALGPLPARRLPRQRPGNGDTSYFFRPRLHRPAAGGPGGFGDGTEVTVDARAPQ